MIMDKMQQSNGNDLKSDCSTVVVYLSSDCISEDQLPRTFEFETEAIKQYLFNKKGNVSLASENHFSDANDLLEEVAKVINLKVERVEKPKRKRRTKDEMALDKDLPRERKFPCNFCSYKAYNKANLLRHTESVHLQIRRFVCEICGQCSGASNKLQYHIDTVHKKLKKFQCHLCNHKASSSHKIQRHVQLIHEKVRPFKCDFSDCSYTAGIKRDLVIHRDSVHLKLKNVACPYCEYKTSQRKILTGHIRRRHPNEENTNSKAH